jgi:hypothetical protein
MATSKFSHVSKDENFDIYVDIGTMLNNRGVYSFWVKSVFSDKGREIIRREIPKNLQKTPIAYSLDFFVYDSNQNQYKMQVCCLYDIGEKEIFRQGNRKQRALKSGTLAELIARSAVEAFNKQ